MKHWINLLTAFALSATVAANASALAFAHGTTANRTT